MALNCLENKTNTKNSSCFITHKGNKRDRQEGLHLLTQKLKKKKLCIIDVWMKKDLCLEFCTSDSKFNLNFFFLIPRYLPKDQASNLSQSWVIFLSLQESFITIGWESK